MTSQQLGKRGEDAAATYFVNSGYRIVERNWRCRYGEIDMIAQSDGFWVFVEVKTRASVSAGKPEEAIPPAKQRRLIRLATEYLHMRNLGEAAVRFDVVAIRVTGRGRANLRHIKGAFGV